MIHHPIALACFFSLSLYLSVSLSLFFSNSGSRDKSFSMKMFFDLCRTHLYMWFCLRPDSSRDILSFY